MGRRPCCEKEGLNRGAWTAMEDKILTDYISLHGEGKWRNLPLQAGLKRCGKSCRLRWMNYLKPDIKRGNITPDEEDLIIRLHKLLGNRWSLIAGRLPGRTDNEIKNYWNTNMVKRVHGLDHPTRQLPFDDHNKLNPPSSALHRHDHHHHHKPPAPKTCVVRTKATRCTKVVISQELQDMQLKSMNSGDKDNHENIKVSIENNSVGANGIMLLEPGPAWALDDSKSSNLKMDGDMDMDIDDHILSRVLEADFSLFSDLDEHHRYHCQEGGGELMSSPLSNDSLILNEDEQGGLDADWITSLLLQSEFILETSN